MGLYLLSNALATDGSNLTSKSFDSDTLQSVIAAVTVAKEMEDLVAGQEINISKSKELQVSANRIQIAVLWFSPCMFF